MAIAEDSTEADDTGSPQIDKSDDNYSDSECSSVSGAQKEAELNEHPGKDMWNNINDTLEFVRSAKLHGKKEIFIAVPCAANFASRLCRNVTRRN